ncbi:MAG: NIPSNAP family containing protein [Acidimicrobiales bacterium]
MNDKVYIHEFIDIIGHNRANYMHHMTANFSPTAQEERDQLCYGVWGVVGTTRRWPEVVNIWEEDGLDGMATSFRYEFNHAGLQDPKLAKWWAKAAEFRSSGTDRLLAPAPWTRTITELCADGVQGETYGHEQVRVPPGHSAEYLEIVRQEAVPVYQEFGWELAGAWETIMSDDSECFFLWAVPTWEQWAAFEKAQRTHPALRKWRDRVQRETRSMHRFLLVDAPLCPFRTHRQPARSDRTDWQE